MSSVADLLAQVADSTPVSFETGTKQFINDAVSRNHLFSELMRNKTDKQTVRTGPTIKDRILLATNGGLKTYTPGQEVNVQYKESHTNHESHWAHLYNDISWTEADKELNINAGSMTSKGVHSHLKDVLAQKEQVAYSNAIEGLDDLFLGTPNAGTMEHTANSSEDATVRCLGSFINEFANGLITGMGNTGGNFTTIQGIDPVANPNWGCQKLTYSVADAATRSHADNLIDKLLLMKRKVKFVRPAMPYPGATEQTSMSDTQFILTGETGLTQWQQTLAQQGDLFINGTDPAFGEFTVGGSRIVEVEALDSVLWYTDGTNLNDIVNASNAGARYYFLDTQYLTVKVHGKKFFERRKTREPSNALGGYWCPIVTWMQLWVDSLRRHGIVSPA